VLRTRRWLAVLCILAVLVGALLAPATGGSSPSILVPLFALFAVVIVPVPLRRIDATPAYSFLPSGPRPSRAPPVIG
jgi:hypothetical protein